MISDIEYTKLMEQRKIISSNEKWGYDETEKEYIKGMSLLNPQSYGSKIEKKIKEELNCIKLKAKDDCGDICSINGKNIEVKISILTLINSALNLVQIRLFHNVDYYLCVAYDCRNISNYKKYIFLLTHDEMESECENANAAHGTKSVNEINKNVELRLSVICDENNTLFQKWCEKYLVDSFEDVKNVF